MLICGNGRSLQIWVQPPHSSPSPLLPQKMSGNPRWRSDMSEVTEKCMRPRGATYVYCIIDKDRRHWDLLPQESPGLTESIFCLLCPPKPLFMFTCPHLLLFFTLSGENHFFGIWVVLKPSQGFQRASVISFFASRESSAEPVSTGWGGEMYPKDCLMPEPKWGNLATYWCVLSIGCYCCNTSKDTIFEHF